jgi:hypothetical protein
MKQVQLLEKFPIFTLEIPKEETGHQNTDDIIGYLKSKVETHPTAVFIACFDHYGHVKAQNGEIDANIKNSKILLFCMSGAIPNAMIASVRPRSIAVNEMDNKFVVSFMEAPMEAPTLTMNDWVSSIKNLSAPTNDSRNGYQSLLPSPRRVS